jgi:hypothetical protein
MMRVDENTHIIIGENLMENKLDIVDRSDPVHEATHICNIFFSFLLEDRQLEVRC